MGIKSVIAVDKMSHPAEEEFEKNMVPVLDAKKVDLEMIDEFAVIERDILDKEIENWKACVETRRNKEEKKQLLKMIDEYRAHRRRPSNED
jgi:predicted RNase H-like nuclease (RuvC/YqgF family)